MGLFAKIKNVFYDEEYIEVPEKEIKKEKVIEPKIEEVVVPVKEEVSQEPRLDNTFSERDLFKAERTFNFPAFDDEEENIEVPPKVTNVLELEKTRTKSESVYKEIPVEEKKVFKPSPVISPIYGILDKNYKKDEIPQRVNPTVSAKDTEMNYDYVRRKAYGTLEDELNHDISSAGVDVLEKVNDIEKEIESLGSSKDHIEDLLNEIEVNSNVSIGELEEQMKDRMEDDEDLTSEIPMKKEVTIENKLEETISDQTLEHDLFNLIDSMYEDKED